jgi:hypothetical protein
MQVFVLCISKLKLIPQKFTQARFESSFSVQLADALARVLLHKEGII